MTPYLLETDAEALLEIERQEEAHGTIPDRASDEQYGGDGPWNNYGEGSDFVVERWKPSTAPMPAVFDKEASDDDTPRFDPQSHASNKVITFTLHPPFP